MFPMTLPKGTRTMTKDEAERMAKRKNGDKRGGPGPDGWRYKAVVVGAKVGGGWVVQRQRNDASAAELYRSHLN